MMPTFMAFHVSRSELPTLLADPTEDGETKAFTNPDESERFGGGDAPSLSICLFLILGVKGTAV
jgi:hypothetical protein